MITEKEAAGTVVEISTTVNSEPEATRIARETVKRKLAACAQVSGPIRSHYFWKGEFCSDTEWRVAMKTLMSHKEELLELLESIHPYETPELLVRRIDAASAQYLDWMRSSLESSDQGLDIK